MLACVFGAERFHTYVFGRSFTIESDHKPLEQINLKNLADTPARLQRMLLRLQNYDVKIIYCPGREMLVADTLSRYAPMPTPEVALDLAIHHVHITPEKKLAFQQSIQDDPLLRSLAETIIAGWPEDIKDLPNALRPYHTYRDVMTVEDGLILRGEALIIPPSERGKVLESIHEGHLGISKCQFPVVKRSGYALMRSSLELNGFSFSRSSCTFWHSVIEVFCCVSFFCNKLTAQLSSTIPSLWHAGSPSIAGLGVSATNHRVWRRLVVLVPFGVQSMWVSNVPYCLIVEPL